MTAPGEDWIAELTATGPVRDDALRRLHALLLRAARFQVSRMSAMRAAVGPAQVEDVINLAADEAMVAVLGKLATFGGRSRFTTWAYKFAVLQAAVELRRHAWSHREVPLDAAPPLVEPRPSPDEYAEGGPTHCGGWAQTRGPGCPATTASDWSTGTSKDCSPGAPGRCTPNSRPCPRTCPVARPAPRKPPRCCCSAAAEAGIDPAPALQRLLHD